MNSAHLVTLSPSFSTLFLYFYVFFFFVHYRMYICVSNTAFCELLCRHCCDDDRQGTRQTIASALLDVPSLPFPFASLFLVSNVTRTTDLLWVPSVNILHPAQLLTNGTDAKPVCPFCLKTDRAPQSSSHACVSYNAPMYV